MEETSINQMKGQTVTLLCAVRALFATHPNRELLLTVFRELYADVEANPISHPWHSSAESLYLELSQNDSEPPKPVSSTPPLSS